MTKPRNHSLWERFLLRLGTTFLRWGTHLVFSRQPTGHAREHDLRRHWLKNRINWHTYTGLQSETGGHGLAYITPVPDYAVQSVINALKEADVALKPDTSFNTYPDEVIPQFVERWGIPLSEQRRNGKTNG